MNQKDVTPHLMMLVFVVMGLFCIWYTVTTRIEAKSSLSWPVAIGVIEAAEMTDSHSSENNTVTYVPKITYRYSVASNDYTGTRIRYAVVSGGAYADAKSILDRYQPGSKVRVYYNRAKPDACVLEPGLYGNSWLPIAAGSLFAGVGIGFWLFRKKIQEYSLRRRALIERLTGS